ncbi:hypothetical protein [Streptomyces sp. NPDC058657]|uniref:hypothetical protein n=1 Tax=unclassified Streptomyces TaxID=2593676 RepID=UPI00366223DF
MKKIIATAGIAAGGVALMLGMQGTAQAAAPRVEAPTVVSQDAGAQPMAAGGLGKALGKAYVHGKAACPSVGKAAGQVLGNLFGSVAPASKINGASQMDTVFDK